MWTLVLLTLCTEPCHGEGMSKDPARTASQIAKEARRVQKDPKAGQDELAHARATEKQMKSFLGRHSKKN